MERLVLLALTADGAFGDASGASTERAKTF
jgi:hypothetical protein